LDTRAGLVDRRAGLLGARIEPGMRDPLPHGHPLGQHEELGQQVYGTVLGGAGHRRELPERPLERGMLRHERHPVGAEHLDPPVQVAGVHLEEIERFVEATRIAGEGGRQVSRRSPPEPRPE
jgi:hypothetical protein